MDLRKIGIIGCGMVGSSTAFALMQSGMFTDIVLVDIDRDRAVGEAMDLSHCLPFTHPVDIRAGGYEDIKDCGIVIITAGVAQKPDETRLDCLKRNADVFRSVIPQIAAHNSDTHLLVVSNPVDVLSFVAQKLSGFPACRVFGSGTALDSARLKYIIGNRLGVDPRSVHAFVVGEHGDSELVVWSSANIGGVTLGDYLNSRGTPSDEKTRRDVEFDVVNSAYAIIERKGATYYGIAAAVKRICESIVRDEHSILPISTLCAGHYGLNDLYISVPTLVGSGGAEQILDIKLDKKELSALHASASELRAALKSIGF